MKNLYPTYRGKLEDGSVVMDMVDRYGRTWATGVGADRVQAQYAARHKMPPKGVIRGVLSYAKTHPIKAALLTSLAVTTYRAVRHHDDRYASGGGLPVIGLGIADFLVNAAVIYLGVKILGWFVKDDSPQLSTL